MADKETKGTWFMVELKDVQFLALLGLHLARDAQTDEQERDADKLRDVVIRINNTPKSD